jgi:WD40 repeat protein
MNMAAPNLDRVRISKTVTHPGDFLSVAREPNSERLWIGHTDFKIYTIDFAVERPQASAAFEGHNSYVSALSLIGRTLVSASWDRKLMWWDTQNRRLLRTVDAHELWIRQLAVSAAQNLLATVSDDMTCKLWDAQSGRLVRQLTGFEAQLPRYDYPNKLFACVFSSDGRHVAAADETCRVIVWETANGREAARFDAVGFFKPDWDRNNHPYGGIRCLAFAPDGRSLALAGMENTDVAIINGKAMVQIFDWHTGRKTCEQKLGSNIQFECLSYHPQAEWLLAAPGGGGGGALYFLDSAQPRVLKEAPATMPTFGLTVNEAADAFYTVGRGKALKWEIPAA